MKKIHSFVLTAAFALACIPLLPVLAASADGIYQTVADVRNHLPDPDRLPNATDPNRQFISFNEQIIRDAVDALIQANKSEASFTDEDKFVVQAASVAAGNRDRLYAVCKLAPQMMARTIYLNITDGDYPGLKAANYQWNGVDVHFLADQLAVKFGDVAAMNPDRSGFLVASGFFNDSLRTPLYKTLFGSLIAGKTEPQAYSVIVGEMQKFDAVKAAHPDVASTGPYKTLYPWLRTQRDFAFRHMKATGTPIPGE